MNKMQIGLIAAVVLLGGVAAYFFMHKTPPAKPLAIVAPILPPMTDQALVAKRDLAYGMALKESDYGWVETPKASVSKGAVTKGESPNAIEDLVGAFVRAPIAKGEVIRRDRLVKGASTSMLSSLLASGMRAIAIDVSINTTAGGFILPNDRVDIVKVYREPELTKEHGFDVLGSELVVTNVRVLAIGPTVESKNGEAVATGATATLEVDPVQAEKVLLAQRSGTLLLELRPISDARPKEDQAALPPEAPDSTLKIVRYGVPTSLRPR
ncbi:MAG: Flp pilus assembly protein CpaB [Methylocystis sp.]